MIAILRIVGVTVIRILMVKNCRENKMFGILNLLKIQVKMSLGTTKGNSKTKAGNLL